MLLGVLLAGCASGGGSGPFGDGGTPGLVCAPVPRGSVLSYGAEEFSNASKATATVSGVDLVSAHRLRLLAAWVVPITGYSLYGVRSGYPPAPILPAGVLWSRRQAANGAHIAHSAGHDVINLVLVIVPLHGEGWASGVNVSYSVAGQSYSVLMQTKLVVVTGSECPAKLPLRLSP